MLWKDPLPLSFEVDPILALPFDDDDLMPNRACSREVDDEDHHETKMTPVVDFQRGVTKKKRSPAVWNEGKKSVFKKRKVEGEEDNGPVEKKKESSSLEKKKKKRKREGEEDNGPAEKKKKSSSLEKKKKKRKREGEEDNGLEKKKKSSSLEKKDKNKKVHMKKRKREGERSGPQWSSERYKAAEDKMVYAIRDVGGKLGNPVGRMVLRDRARNLIGDTGLLDHLLKHMVGQTVANGSERIQIEGAMEYWLEPADTVEIRLTAGVTTNPFWYPPTSSCPDQNSMEEATAQINSLLQWKNKIEQDIGEMLKCLQDMNVHKDMESY